MTFVRRNIDHHLSDLELITKYQTSGNIQYVSDLYQRYLELVYGVCLKYLNDEACSKDATMEIFEILRIKLKGHSVENFRSWLYAVVKNHCLQIIRRQNKATISVDSQEFMHSDKILHHDNDFELIADHTDLYHCMDNLPIGQRESIKWFYFEKKSYEEIAMILQVSHDQVRSYIQNGRRNLRNCLNNRNNGKP